MKDMKLHVWSNGQGILVVNRELSEREMQYINHAFSEDRRNGLAIFEGLEVVEHDGPLYVWPRPNVRL